MTLRAFTRGFLLALAHEEEHPEADNAEIVETIRGSDRRWMRYETIIFKYEGKYYRTGWDVPLTETSGEFAPFNDKKEVYELDEVQKVPQVSYTFMNYREHMNFLAKKGEQIQAEIDALPPVVTQ